MQRVLSSLATAGSSFSRIAPSRMLEGGGSFLSPPGILLFFFTGGKSGRPPSTFGSACASGWRVGCTRAEKYDMYFSSKEGHITVAADQFNESLHVLVEEDKLGST